LTVQAVALNPPIGSQVSFSLDNGAEITAIPAGDGLYTAQFSPVDPGEHEIAAIMRDADGVEIYRDINDRVGVGGGYSIAVGDSITNGIGDEIRVNDDSDDGRIVSAYGFVAPLNNALTIASGRPQIVFNEGIPGIRSVDLTGPTLDSILERHPGARSMLLLIGTNDASSGPAGVADTVFRDNLIIAVNSALLDPVIDRVYIAKIPPRYDLPSRNPIIETYNLRIDEVVNSDPNDDVLPGPDLYTLLVGQQATLYDSTGLHPNDAGYQAIADAYPNDAGYQAIADAWDTVLPPMP
jgi:lysophospholipase L1-like esterase